MLRRAFSPIHRHVSFAFLAAMLVLAVVAAALVVLNMSMSGTSAAPRTADDDGVSVPDYDYSAWHSLPVQDGRTKPLETACTEAVRKITGKARFEEVDSVALVLAWKLSQDKSAVATSEGESSQDGFPDWESYPFILCRHLGLRAAVFAHLPEAAAKARAKGKFVSPAELRSSPGFDKLLSQVADHRAADPSKAHFQMSVEERKAEQVIRRLVLYDAIRGRRVTRLHTNALVGQQFVTIPNSAAAEKARLGQEPGNQKPLDPIHLIDLDKTDGSAWFSITELKMLRDDPTRWQVFLSRRIAENPHRYLSAKHQQSLVQFQGQVESGKGKSALRDLAAKLSERRTERIQEFQTAHRSGDFTLAKQIFNQIASLAAPDRVKKIQFDLEQASNGPDEALNAASREIDAVLRESMDADLGRLEQSITLAESEGYRPDDPKFRMLHLDYLETRFPDVYGEALAAHPYPDQSVGRALAQWDELSAAYQSGSADQFARASGEFIDTVNKTTVDDDTGTIRWELTYNRLQPFFWSWIVMASALLLLLISMPLNSRSMYLAGLACYILSIVVQAYGFAARIYIAGRAPVGNMYETVIWAALMSAVFALMLELIYRRKVIAIAGAIVSAMALLLADQLPLALDPTISQLAPVLRTNYWLTLHVLTIVSGYAAGTLAWGLGNLTLGLLAFGKGDGSTLKMLSRFTYRAIQITVLLLATGTFLGGWWAAESWGRFWGWDPKEVGALIALVCYVVPLHARYIGWIKDFGLALSAVVCFASIILSWYVVNFVFAAGLHSYGFGGSGGMLWVLAATLLNLEWVLLTCWICWLRHAPELKDESTDERTVVPEVTE